MKKQRTYGQGIAVGLFLGVTGLLVLPRLLSGARSVPATRADALEHPSGKSGFVSRRDQPESAGDPMQGTGATFTRGGGAPGPGRQGEQLAMPGRPGQVVNTTRTRKVKVANRALPIRKTATRRTRAVTPSEPATEA